MCDDVNELQRAHVWIVSKMTHCGATISYAVCLLTTEPTTCVPLFLLSCLNDFSFFFCLVIPRQLPCDCTEKLTRQKRRKKNPNTHQSLFQHIFSFLLVYFFSCLEKQKQKLITDDPLSSIPKARPRVGRAARFVKIHEKIQMRVHLIQSSSESRDPSAGV